MLYICTLIIVIVALALKMDKRNKLLNFINNKLQNSKNNLLLQFNNQEQAIEKCANFDWIKNILFYDFKYPRNEFYFH